MTIHFKDDFTDTDGVQLSAHVPSPIADPGTIWEYIEAGAAPYEISSNGIIDVGTGVANPARSDQNILDDLIKATGSFNRAGPLTAAQTGQLHICASEVAIVASFGRITAEVNNTHIIIHLFDDTGTLTRSSTSVLHSRDITVLFELVITKAGTSVEVYAQDIGGGSRVSDFLTLSGPEQTLYEDGVHRRTGISCTGTGAGHYFCGFMQVEDFVSVQADRLVDYGFHANVAVSKDQIVTSRFLANVSVVKSTVISFRRTANIDIIRDQITGFHFSLGVSVIQSIVIGFHADCSPFSKVSPSTVEYTKIIPSKGCN